jgi:subtilisin-like proprotein convertase family protein
MAASESVTINADAYDLNNMSIASSIVWRDSLGNILGNGSSVTVSGLSVGRQTISATATDSAARTGSFEFDIAVNAEPDPIAIPDLGTVVATLSIDAASAVLIDDVNISLDITHSRAEDLDVFLIAPDGTRVELFSDVGLGRNFTDTTLDDEASRSVTDYTSPLTGSFRPEGSLSTLIGKNSEGTWSLEVTDDRRRQTGTLDHWSLDISGSPAVPNDHPEINSTPVTVTTQDAAYSYDVDATDINPGDTLAYSLDTSPSGMSIDPATGQINWTPASNQVGFNAVTVRVQDQLGGSDTQSFTVDVANVNDAPVAVDDSYDVQQDMSLNVAASGLLGNDTDADGDSLSVSQHTQPTHGTVVVNPDGSFSYTPNPGFTGSDSFTYQISDGTADGNFATVSLEVAAPNADEALYVYDIRFESKRGNKDWRAVFEIRRDSNANGIGDTSDDAAVGVAITVNFGGNTYSGVTDSSGLFRTSWLRNVPSGNYFANIDALFASGFTWDPLDVLNQEDDSDGDGYPDHLLVR